MEFDLPVRSSRYAKGNRFRDAAVRAAVKNPVETLPFLASPAWAVSTAYVAGQVVRANGYQWVCSLAGTSAGSGSGPADVNTASGYVDDGTTRWLYLPGLFRTSDDAMAPTVLGPTTTAPSGMQSWATLTYPELLKVYGGFRDTGVAGYLSVVTRRADAAGSYTYAGARVAWMTDAPVVWFLIASSTAPIRILVDGRYVSDDALVIGASNKYVGLDLTVLGGRSLRRIEIQGQSRVGGLMGVQNIVIGTGYQLYPVPADDLRVAFIADSQMAGTGYGNYHAGGSILARMADLLGWRDPWCFAISGTGYCRDGGVGSYTYGARVPDVIATNPDAVVLFGSTNDQDNSFTVSQVQAAALAAWQDLRAGLPDAPIIIFGIVPKAVASATFETGLKAQFDAWGDPNSYFIPISTATPVPWLLGSFNNAALPSVNSYAQDITNQDNTHLVQRAMPRWARMMADAIRGAVLPNL